MKGKKDHFCIQSNRQSKLIIIFLFRQSLTKLFWPLSDSCLSHLDRISDVPVHSSTNFGNFWWFILLFCMFGLYVLSAYLCFVSRGTLKPSVGWFVWNL